MKTGTSMGRIPAKVSVKHLAIVTAGFAKDVEAVNQYAAMMNEATAKGVIAGRDLLQLRMTATKPKVATISLKPWLGPERTC